MPKNNKVEEVSIKEFQKLIEDIDKLKSEISSIQDLPKQVQSLDDQIKKVRSKLDEFKDFNKTIQNVLEQTSKANVIIDTLKNEIEKIKRDIVISQERIEQTIRTQEEIIMDMISKFNNELLNHKGNVLDDIQRLKTQQDILKISNTVNDKKLIAKIEEIVDKTLTEKIQGKENEILMKLWLNDFKEIISNFEKLKSLKPKEFSIKLDEISEILEMYKEKLQSYS